MVPRSAVDERISMSKLKHLIGLQSSNLSVPALGRALGLSVGAVSNESGAPDALTRASKSHPTLKLETIRRRR